MKRIDSPETLKCYNSIKKLAEDKNIDIYITKNKESKYLPHEDMYLVIAQKEIPIIERLFFQIGKTIKHGTGCTILSKKAGAEELSTRVYNAAINAIETLEKKLNSKIEG